MASACIHLLGHFDGPQQVNVGTGDYQTIKEISENVANATGFTGQAGWDMSKPDGTRRKLLDVSTLRNSGWQPNIPLVSGIEQGAWYRENRDVLRR
jgi:GDP-L-fucose synthase